MAALALALLLADVPVAQAVPLVPPPVNSAPEPAAIATSAAAVPAAGSLLADTASAPPPPLPTQPLPTLQAQPPSAAVDKNVIVVKAGVRATAADPLAKINAEVFSAVQKVDEAVVGPIAIAYKKTLPNPVRVALRHIMTNLKTPVLLANNLLQFKPVGAARVLARFAINSTVGIGGIFDVAAAKPFHLKYIDNGFGFTMGYYGIKPGPYFYLPVIGPTTLRDLAGGLVDGAVLPAVVPAPFASPYYSVATGVITSLDDRVEFDCLIHEWRATGNPYLAERREWIRQYQPDAPFEIFPGIGHWVQYEAAEPFNRRLSELVKAAVS